MAHYMSETQTDLFYSEIHRKYPSLTNSNKLLTVEEINKIKAKGGCPIPVTQEELEEFCQWVMELASQGNMKEEAAKWVPQALQKYKGNTYNCKQQSAATAASSVNPIDKPEETKV